jgi:isopentenyldiphosphate isomerase
MSSDPGTELAEWVDNYDQTLGIRTRAEIRSEKLLYRCACVIVKNSAGEIYVHRRTETKDIFPGMYDMFVAGMLAVGESYEEGARRELSEELGVADAELDFLLRFRYEGLDNPSFNVLFETTYDGDIRPQAEEIAWGTFLSERDVILKLDEWPFVPDGLELFERYLEL